MTKKDYEMIADAISSGLKSRYDVNHMARYIAESIADGCAEDNRRFDRDKFLAACGVR